MEPEISTTNKGKPLLNFNGYSYIIERRSELKTIWRCTKYTSEKCRGRAHTVDTKIVKINEDLEHAPDHSSTGVRLSNEKLKKSAKETSLTTREVVTNCTFKSSPLLFNQMFIIVGKYQDTHIPLLYCLMEDRKEESYKTLFRYLMDAIGEYQPLTMMSDYEIAPRNAFSSAFPETIQRGCFFHNMQCICNAMYLNF